LGILDAFGEADLDRLAELLEPRLRPVVEQPSGWLRGADAIGEYIGSPRSRVYALAACTPPRIPVERDGSSLVARRSDLDTWLRSGGGTRP
jgi:hypothetical protein